MTDDRPATGAAVSSSRPTILDVAARAGVSKSLVSLALRGSPAVAETSRAAILAAAAELGYRPNAAARSLVARSSRTIGVLVLDLHNPVFAEILDGVLAGVRARGYSTMLVTGGSDPALEQTEIVDAPTLARQDLLLLGSGHCFRDQVLRFCPECNQLSYASDNMQRTLEGSSLETIRLMVATGMGITVLPYTSVSGYAHAGDLLSVRPFAAPVPSRVVALAWRKSFPRHRVINLLAEAIRACPLGEAVRLLESV